VRIHANPQIKDIIQKAYALLFKVLASSIKPSLNLVLALNDSPNAIMPVGKNNNTAKALTHRQS
jgi:hypothetical protein